MAVPIVSWFQANQTTQITAGTPYTYGTLDAGTDVANPVHTFYIWNNKGGATDVSKMEAVTITTRDKNFGDGSTVGQENYLVKDNWMHVQVDSNGETDIDQNTSRVGKDFAKALTTTGSTIKDNTGASITPVTPATQEILGIKNNGNYNDAKGNYVKISTKLFVPLLASSGKIDFKLRCAYRFV